MDKGCEGGLDICVLDVCDGLFADMVVWDLNVVELG